MWPWFLGGGSFDLSSTFEDVVSLCSLAALELMIFFQSHDIQLTGKYHHAQPCSITPVRVCLFVLGFFFLRQGLLFPQAGLRFLILLSLPP